MSNILRNGALHTGTPSRQINQYQHSALHVILGSQLDNPNTTYGSTSFRIPYGRHEDSAGNLLHMLIILLVVVILPIKWLHGHYTKTVWYAVSIILGVVLYCWILKWQPWASRLHTPLFALAAPLLAIVITSIGKVKKHTDYAIIVCMILYSFPFVLANKSRRLVSLDWHNNEREQLYFNNKKALFDDYKSAMNVFGKKNLGEVGLYLAGDEWESPFWVFEGQKEKMKFRHVGVSNVSRMIDNEDVLPLYVIATKALHTWKHASKYDSIYASDHVGVFRRSGHNNAMHTDGNSAVLHSRR